MTRKRRDLTDDEQTLWDRITKAVKPLKSEKKHAKAHSPKIKTSTCPPLRKQPSFSWPLEEPSRQKQSSSSTHRIRRVRQVEVRARLDLHGYTHKQARKQLGQFLGRCQGYGYLWVLVITGKGRRHINKEEPYSSTSKRMALQDLVPQWLEEADFRPFVSAYTTAKPQDGGTGALYIRLKRLR